MSRLRQEVGVDRVVAISGGFEFLSPEGAPASDYFPDKFKKLYELLDYDVVHLAPMEWRWLEKRAVALPENWKEASGRRSFEVLNIDGVTLAFVFVPAIEGPDAETAAQQFVVEQVAEARKTADVIVGISHLGYPYEERLLKSHPDLFHILLGSGAGRSNDGLQRRQGETLWLRPYYKGAVVSRIDIKRVPDRKPEATSLGSWVRGVDFDIDVIPLYDNIPGDTKAMELMQNN